MEIPLNDCSIQYKKVENCKHTVFGVVVGQSEGIIRIGGVPAQLSALCVEHGDCVL